MTPDNLSRSRRLVTALRSEALMLAAEAALGIQQTKDDQNAND